MVKTLIPSNKMFLTHLLSFSWQIFHLKNINVYTLCEGSGSEKMYVLYTDLNVDNYGSPLTSSIQRYYFTSKPNLSAT